MTPEEPVVQSGRRDWSWPEVEATVADYFEMYARELAGLPYNKSAHRRALLAQLDGRNDRAVEEKHRNISAVLAEQGLPFIDGYKPRFHYQRLLQAVVLSRLDAHPELVDLVARPSPSEGALPAPDPTTAFVEPPGRSDWSPSTSSPVVHPARDYVALAAENSALGARGEEFVVELERRRLTAHGRPDLATRVEHVSQTRGDGLGFDVLSAREDGSELHIEVKTTKYGAATPFYLSAREEAYSREQPDKFCLYRVFRWSEARVFRMDGPIAGHFSLVPSTFRAVR